MVQPLHWAHRTASSAGQVRKKQQHTHKKTKQKTKQTTPLVTVTHNWDTRPSDQCSETLTTVPRWSMQASVSEIVITVITTDKKHRSLAYWLEAMGFGVRFFFFFVYRRWRKTLSTDMAAKTRTIIVASKLAWKKYSLTVEWMGEKLWIALNYFHTK